MADSILRLQVESQEYDAKLKKAAEGIRHLVEVAHKGAGELTGLEKSELDYIRALGEMETKSRTASGQVRELSSTYKELKVVYNQLNEVEKADEGGKALAASLEKLKQRALDAKKEMNDINAELGNTNQTSGIAGGMIDALTQKLTINFDALTLMNKGLGLVNQGLDVAKEAFFSSEANVDAWGRTIASNESLYRSFLTALNNSDISGFLGRIDQIIDAARKAYDELDRLGTMKTIQGPAVSAQQTENERMRMMIQTGRYIAPVDGRRASMANGTMLTPDQIRSIEQKLQQGMAKIVSLTSNEVKQTGRAIDAVYQRMAKENNMSMREFRKGTSSMEEFDKRMKGYEQYQRYEREHTITSNRYNPQTGDYENFTYRDQTRNPYQQYRNWGTFRVDAMGKGSYNELVDLIRQRDQQAGQAYGMQSQAFRTMNRAEGMTVSKIMRGETAGTTGGGSGRGGGSTTTDPITKAADEVVKAEQSYAENINVAQEKLMANVMKSEEYDKLVLSGQERLADAYLKAYNTTGNDKYLDVFRETSEHILDMRGVVDANIQAQKLAERATREQAEAAKKLAEAERKRSEQYANWHSNSTSGIGSYISYQQGVLGQQTIGTSDYAQVASNLADANAYKNLMQVAIQNGLNDLVVDAAPLWQKIIGEVDVQDSTWKELQDKINIRLKKLGIKPIKIDFATGSLSGESKGGEKHENQIGKVVSGMTSITNSLQHIGVEIPEGFNKVINIMNIIQTILTTVGSFGSAGSFLSGIPLIGGFFSLFGLANGGVVHAANGFSGIVPGNLMSGDQIPALLNSGEVVLNRAQAGVLASDMRQGSIGYEGRTQAIIESDQIKLVLRNGAQARGMTLSDYLEI